MKDCNFKNDIKLNCFKPVAIMAAPANPPISVCEDEDGIPFHHVIRFQVMAAMTPANIIGK